MTHPMQGRSLSEVSHAIVESWSPETCHATPEFVAAGRPGDRTRGQCGTSALVLQDWLGGTLLVADVCVEGKLIGVHYWNRLPVGTEVDLTQDQFQPGETLSKPREVTRPPGLPRKGVDAYLLLASRVGTVLG